MYYNAGAAAAAAAERRRKMAEEEEEMTPYTPGDLEGHEFKIIRSITGAFKHPAKLRAVLDEEAQAGWELVEKFDNGRVRLKRKLEWRSKDHELTFDPYRITVGMSEGKLVAVVLISVFGGIAVILGVVFGILAAAGVFK